MYTLSIMRTTLAAWANILLTHGNDILLIKRSKKCTSWPGFWALPGWKLDAGELFREAALRELTEEVGIIASVSDIERELCITTRSFSGVKTYYFGVLDDWNWIPENKELSKIEEIWFFSITSLPENIVPHHMRAIQELLLTPHNKQKNYLEIDYLP